MIRTTTGLAAALLALVLVQARAAAAQTSTGTIAGLVTDPAGAFVASAEVTIARVDTGLVRHLLTNEAGRYAAPGLPPGHYTAQAASQGPAMRSQMQSAVVQSGRTIAIDLLLRVQAPQESVVVSGPPAFHSDHHSAGGWIDRQTIDEQPLNGANVLELAKLEPGVLPPDRISGGRVFVAPFGAGLPTIPRVGFTRVTFDGGNIETPGTVGTLLQVSPDAVEELHVATANFDASQGLATSGVVDMVSRSGTNRVSGSGFLLYRDRRWSAFSSSLFGPTTADPEFRRLQSGVTIGGPLHQDRAFYFAAIARHDQRDAVTISSADPDLRTLGGTFESPYSGTQFNGRIDVRVSGTQQAFVRHTRDANSAFAIADVPGLPSGWADRPIRAHQTLAGLTSVLSGTVVHDVRVSYYSTSAAVEPATAGDCAPPCLGLDAPRIILSDGGSNGLSLGQAAANHAAGQRVQVSDSVVWQTGAHLVSAGVDWERSSNTQTTGDSDPVLMTLWTPAAARARNPGLTLPATLATIDDILRLPLRSFSTSVGTSELLQRGFADARVVHLLRTYAGDQWHIGSRVTINGGLSWAFEPRVLNSDLRKPEWLAPLVGGTDGLGVPDSHNHLSGTAGLVWRVRSDGRTVVRAGAGEYYDSVARTVSANLATERVELSPLGTGRLTVSGTNIIWNGTRLNFPSLPTGFTGADLLAILPAIRASLEQSIDPGNRDSSVVNLDRTKEGRNLYDPSYGTPRAAHASVEIDHDFGGLIVSTGVVWKRFDHTFINGLDYNRFLAASGPLIRTCTQAERLDVTAACANGSLFFDTTSGRARYAGLTMRIERRFGPRAHALVSYAFGSFTGNNGTGTATQEATGGRVFGFNNDNWSENVGPLPTDVRHLINVSGFFRLPARFELSLNATAYGRAPFAAYLAGIDFNGDGTTNDLLPGTRINQFNRGLNAGDLVRLVEQYNELYADRITAGGQHAPRITLPAHFEFGDAFFTVDLRISRSFGLGGSWRLDCFADIFNAFDTKNLTGYSGNLSSPTAFGQPTGRVGQAFGSGGPRAMQIGVRVDFQGRQYQKP